jgi:hypothetical protein
LEWLGEASGMPQLVRSSDGVERAEAQIAQARRELDKGNAFACDYHIAAAEDALHLPETGGVPGRLTRIVQTAKRTRTNSSKGGKRAAEKKKSVAIDWQTKIKPKVKRYIAAGKTDSNIGALLASDVGRSADVVRKFSAKVRSQK